MLATSSYFKVSQHTASEIKIKNQNSLPNQAAHSHKTTQQYTIHKKYSPPFPNEKSLHRQTAFALNYLLKA